MPVSFMDLQLAFEFVSTGGVGENQAFVDSQSGKIYCRSELLGYSDEGLPDDIEDEKYIGIPHKNELDLDNPLVLDFVDRFLPDDYDEVRRIFSRKGAYGRFKDLLARRDALDRWYDFSAKAEEARAEGMVCRKCDRARRLMSAPSATHRGGACGGSAVSSSLTRPTIAGMYTAIHTAARDALKQRLIRVVLIRVDRDPAPPQD